MYVVFVAGTSVSASPVGARRAFSGSCLEETEQTVHALKEQDHVYFISYGEPLDAGRIAVCDACHTVTPVIARAARGEAERMVDAFLDAHQLEAERMDRSLWSGLACMGTIAAAGLLLLITGWLLPPLWVLPAGLVASVAGFVVYQDARTRIGNARFGRAATPKLARLVQLTGWTVEDVMEHADARGFLRLRDFLASVWLDDVDESD